MLGYARRDKLLEKPRKRRVSRKQAQANALNERREAERRMRQRVGSHLRWLREALEVLQPGEHSLPQWAARNGYDFATWFRWERGDYQPPLAVLGSIALSYGASFEYFIYGVLPDVMPEDLRTELVATHGLSLSTQAAWDQHREQAFRAAGWRRRPAQPGGSPRPPSRPKK